MLGAFLVAVIALLQRKRSVAYSTLIRNFAGLEWIVL